MYKPIFSYYKIISAVLNDVNVFRARLLYFGWSDYPFQKVSNGLINNSASTPKSMFLKQRLVLVSGFTITPRKLSTRKYKENK